MVFGAVITGPQADLNLGLKAIVDAGQAGGEATTTLDQIRIDTTKPGTHTIVYFGTTGSASPAPPPEP